MNKVSTYLTMTTDPRDEGHQSLISVKLSLVRLGIIEKSFKMELEVYFIYLM